GSLAPMSGSFCGHAYGRHRHRARFRHSTASLARPHTVPPRGRARLYAFLAGLAVTAVLQSSTATGLMATSFTASGAIGLAPAVAVMLGANIGATLITRFWPSTLPRWRRSSC